MAWDFTLIEKNGLLSKKAGWCPEPDLNRHDPKIERF
jgi:hypothetical protein